MGDGGTAGTISTTGAITNNGTLAINRSNAFSTSQQITGTGSFVHAGSGTTTLTATNNDYTGTTSVRNGELQMRGLTGTSAVTVGETGGSLTNAATLSGTGTIAGAVAVGSATSVGILAPGATALAADKGGLTISAPGAALTVASGSQLQIGIGSPTNTATPTVTFANGQYEFNGGTYATAGLLFSSVADNNGLGGADGAEALAIWNIAPTTATNHDFLNLTGANSNLTIGTRASGTFGDGSIKVVGSGLTGVAAGQVFNLIDWQEASVMNANITSGFVTGSTPMAGDLDLPDISGFGLAWDTSAFAAYGILVVVPEPSRMLLLMLGLLALFFRRRRRL